MSFEVLNGKLIEKENSFEVGKTSEVELFEHSKKDIKKTIYIRDNSKLSHYILQENSSVNYNIFLEQNAEYNLFIVQKGEDFSKNNIEVNLAGSNSKADVNIAYNITEKSLVENNVFINHLVPYTFSNQLIKGILADTSKANFHGKIHIAKNAVKVEGNQLHKSILLSDKAKVKCLPELEIFADDVKCSHGAATGVLDEMQLFYMCSRGIDYNDARNILIEAFLEDVFSKIKNEEVYNRIKKDA